MWSEVWNIADYSSESTIFFSIFLDCFDMARMSFSRWKISIQLMHGLGENKINFIYLKQLEFNLWIFDVWEESPQLDNTCVRLQRMLSPFLGVIDYSHHGLPQHVVRVDNGRPILASASHSTVTKRILTDFLYVDKLLLVGSLR